MAHVLEGIFLWQRDGEMSRAEGAVRALAAVSRPVVALVHGPCMGGGLGLALAADLRWAADDARFAALDLPPQARIRA